MPHVGALFIFIFAAMMGCEVTTHHLGTLDHVPPKLGDGVWYRYPHEGSSLETPLEFFETIFELEPRDPWKTIHLRISEPGNFVLLRRPDGYSNPSIRITYYVGDAIFAENFSTFSRSLEDSSDLENLYLRFGTPNFSSEFDFENRKMRGAYVKAIVIQIPKKNQHARLQVTLNGDLIQEGLNKIQKQKSSSSTPVGKPGSYSFLESIFSSPELTDSEKISFLTEFNPKKKISLEKAFRLVSLLETDFGRAELLGYSLVERKKIEGGPSLLDRVEESHGLEEWVFGLGYYFDHKPMAFQLLSEIWKARDQRPIHAESVAPILVGFRTADPKQNGQIRIHFARIYRESQGKTSRRPLFSDWISQFFNPNAGPIDVDSGLQLLRDAQIKVNVPTELVVGFVDSLASSDRDFHSKQDVLNYLTSGH